MPKTLPATLEHVSRIEDSIDRFVASVGVEFNKLYNLQTRSEAEAPVAHFPRPDPWPAPASSH